MNYKGTMTSEFFEKWFVEFLMKEVKPNSVIILDNASFHKIEKLREYAKKIWSYSIKFTTLLPRIKSNRENLGKS